MATLDEIQQLLAQIRDEIPLLVQNSRIPAVQIVTGEGLSDISERLGLIQAGEFRTGNGKEPGFGFSGVRIGYPAFVYNSQMWHVAGVNNDLLQVGINANDGKLYAGAGVVTLDANGIIIEVTNSGEDERSYKFKFSGGTIIGGLYGVEPTPGNPRINLSVGGASFSNSEATILAEGTDQGEVFILGIKNGVAIASIRVSGSSSPGIVLNDEVSDVDTIIRGATDTSLFYADAGLDAIGMGGAAESGYKLKVTGNMKVTGSITNGTLGGTMFLPFGVYRAISPLSVDSDPYSVTVDRTISFVKWSQFVYVATTNDGSNYWTIRLLKQSDNSVINSISTAAISANTNTVITDTTFSIASVGASDYGIYMNAVKTGSPGNLYLQGPLLEVQV
jgi:hypothetical protein